MNTLSMIRTCRLVFLLPFFFMACSSDDSSAIFGTGGNGKSVKGLPGMLYWDFSSKVGRYDFSSGKLDLEYMDINVFDGFDISWDDKNILLTRKADGAFNFDERRIIIRKNEEGIRFKDIDGGGNIADFNFEWGGISTTYGHFSPNGQYIALRSIFTSELPITIIDSKTGAIISNWYVEGENFRVYGDPIWTADNTLYFRIGNVIYKTGLSDNFSSAPAVFQRSGISNLTVNPQGTKVVYRQKKHLYLADIDGNNPVQITDSDTYDFIDYDGEKGPVFSPDGKYIAFIGASKRGTPWSDHDYPDGSWVAATGGSYGYLIVIPATGEYFDLEDVNSGAIWLKDESGFGIPSYSDIIWR